LYTNVFSSTKVVLAWLSEACRKISVSGVWVGGKLASAVPPYSLTSRARALVSPAL
jgi:hypothetical protein